MHLISCWQTTNQQQQYLPSWITANIWTPMCLTGLVLSWLWGLLHLMVHFKSESKQLTDKMSWMMLEMQTKWSTANCGVVHVCICCECNCRVSMLRTILCFMRMMTLFVCSCWWRCIRKWEKSQYPVSFYCNQSCVILLESTMLLIHGYKQ